MTIINGGNHTAANRIDIFTQHTTGRDLKPLIKIKLKKCLHLLWGHGIFWISAISVLVNGVPQIKLITTFLIDMLIRSK